jgi:hypothetical protein
VTDPALRDKFLRLIERFNAGALDVSGLWNEVEVLNKEGFRRALRGGEEQRVVREFIIWYLDMYDPSLQPRTGVIGRIKDTLDEMFRAVYRVSLEELREKARVVERVMKA